MHLSDKNNKTPPPSPLNEPMKLSSSLVEDPVLKVLDGLVLLHLVVLLPFNLGREVIVLLKFSLMN